MTSGLQVPFWESVWVTPSHYPRTGRIREQAWSRVLVPRQSGFLDSFSETRLFGAEGFIGPSHFRPSCSVASELRFRFLRRCRRGGFLLGCFTAASTKQREGILGTEGEPASGLFTGGTQSDVDAAVFCPGGGQWGFQGFLLFSRAQVGVCFVSFSFLFAGLVLFQTKCAGLALS